MTMIDVDDVDDGCHHHNDDDDDNDDDDGLPIDFNSYYRFINISI